jgi:hypothetical protein
VIGDAAGAHKLIALWEEQLIQMAKELELLKNKV